MIVNASGLFSQPLVQIKLDLDTNKIIKYYNQIIKPNKSKENINPLNQYLSHFGDGQDGKGETLFVAYPDLKYIKDIITEAGNKVYVDVLNYDGEVEITNCWLNVAEVGASQPFHNHGNSVISGTFYVKTDENSNLTFQSPFTQSSNFNNTIINYPSKKENDKYSFHYTYLNIPVNEGDCLFWNSYLNHGYFNNKTQGRMSISFNMIPKKLRHFYTI